MNLNDNSNPPAICIVVEDESQRSLANALSRELVLPLVDVKTAESFTHQFRVSSKGLQLLAAHQQGKSRLFAEFVRGATGYRRKHGGGYRQTIAKAVGIKGPKYSLTVLDATAGLGRDAFVLACLGCEVHLVERSAIIAALLKDGLARARQEPELCTIVQERISVSVADAQKILSAMESSNEGPDVVYLDPMFPGENKSALTGVDLRIIRDIVGPDLDAEKLFNIAMKVAKQRVVVKRSKKAANISAMKPSFSLIGRSHRYDVYILN